MATAGTFLAYFVSPHWLLCAALLAAPFQIYVASVDGLDPSFALVASLLLLVASLKHLRGRIEPAVLLYGSLIVATAASLSWSPEPATGGVVLIERIAFLGPLLAALGMARRGSSAPYRALALALVASSVPAAMTIAFRLVPSIEAAFLTSAFAKIVIEPDTVLALFGEGRNNVLDVAKAGGVFINANVAAAFHGVVASLAIGLGSTFSRGASKRRFFIFLGLLSWVAVFHTGSKAGAIAGLAMPLAAFALVLAKRHIVGHSRGLADRKVVMGAITLLFVASAVPIVGEPITQPLEGFALTAEEALDARAAIWVAGLDGFLDRPLLGHGFGGWTGFFEPRAARLGIDPSFPPHNVLLFIWSQSGLLAVLLAFAFIAAATSRLLASFLGAQTHHAGFFLATLMALLWVVVQGMTENYWIVGEVHIQPILGAALGLSLVARNPVPHKTRSTTD